MNYKLINPIDSNKSIVEQILNNRGIQDIQTYLNPNDSVIYNPNLINNMQQGVEMLFRHLGKDLIYLIVDDDDDGFTSAAIFLNYLYKIVPSIVEANIIYDFHPHKAHGIWLDQIPQETKLVIALDSSSNEYDIHEQLSNKGIDVLVIDHHKADKVSPFACVINNQLCDYPTKSLSGAGMVYKFCKYIDNLLNLNYADDFLDLVSLGLTGDVMSLRDLETSYLTRKGLENIQNPFMREMVEKNSYQLGTDITSIGVAFYIVPYINAVARLGTKEEKKILFEAMLDWKALNQIPSTKRGCKGQMEAIVTQAARMSNNIKNRQNKIRDENIEIISNQIEEKDLLKNKILIIQSTPEEPINRSISGLIANRLVSEYQRPVIILNEYNIDNEITWEGSARGYEKSQLKDLQTFEQKSNLINWAQGHANAHGLSISDENLSKFIDYCNQELKNVEFTPDYRVDFIWQYSDILAKNILDIGNLKHLWGKDVEEALIVIKGIRVTANNLHLMAKDRNPTLKIDLKDNIKAIKFKSGEEEYNNLYTKQGCVIIDILCKCEINEYCGNINPQLIIQDYEIVSHQDYFF
jgi:single-stranded-DNA-specific exonuclease